MLKGDRATPSLTLFSRV